MTKVTPATTSVKVSFSSDSTRTWNSYSFSKVSIEKSGFSDDISIAAYH